MLRVIWGFIGTEHARFSDFAFGPFRALTYLGELARRRSQRYLGHSPAGAWMVYLLLLTLAATVLTGMTLLAIEKQQGPLAPLFASSSAPPTATIALAPEEADERNTATSGSGPGEDVIEEMHEILANLVLILVILHILGVVIASVSHRENLVGAMVTGNKRSDAI